MPRGVYKRSEEHKRNLQRSAKERVHSPDCTCGICDAKKGVNHGFQKGSTPWNAGRTKETDLKVGRIGNRTNHPKGETSPITGTKRSDEFKQRDREAHLGKASSKKGKTYKEFYGEKRAEEIKQKSRESHRGKANPNQSKRMKRLWQDSKYKDKVVQASLVGNHQKPNKPEKFLTKLLQKLFPNEWKYVGDGQFILGGKCPDFININGQKKIIELFGDYWHRNDNPQDRIDLFAGYGYQTLVIWESEIKNIDKVTNRIMEFNNV